MTKKLKSLNPIIGTGYKTLSTIKDGEDGNMENFPDTLPSTPVVTTTVYGFANIEVRWTFENKVYYQYEVYASKEADFTPNTFNLIHQGQTSSFMYQAKPNETWYFKVCAVNTHGERTNFSNQAVATTKKIEDLSNYVENMAIGEALIGKLSLDRGWIGKLNANLLDVKGNFSVTDGNGKRTLDIDSFGNVNLDVTSLKISSKGVATQDYANNINDRVSSLNNKYTEIKQTVDSIDLTGLVSFSDLSSSGRTTIHGGNIKANTLSISSLSSNNANPIIKLFPTTSSDGTSSYCSIDATKYKNEGVGNSIRLKRDNSNYVYIGDGNIAFYLTGSSNNNSALCTFTGSTSYFKMSTKGGLLELNNGLWYNNTKMATITDSNNAYNLANSANTTANSAKTTANSANTTANSALSKANSAYNLADSAYDRASSSGHYHTTVGNPNSAIAIAEYTSYTGMYTLRKHVSTGMDLGSDVHRWSTIYSVYSLDTSDIKYKENIKYLDDNARLYTSDTHTPFLDFLKNDFKPATYVYKERNQNGEIPKGNYQIGFIANDIINTEVGQTFLYNFGTEEETDIMYSPTGYTTVVAKALQEEIQIREKLEERVAQLEELVNKLLEK